jgi:hypothetical protein
MRRWPTWLVAGALVALGVVALADALRGGAAEVRAQPSTTGVRGTTMAVGLREPRGILYYSDAEDDCRLHGVSLPRLTNAPPPEFRSCRFSLSPDSTSALSGEAVWSPRGVLYAREADGRIELGSASSDAALAFAGRAPAFLPDGTLTYVRGDAEIVKWATDCPPGERLFTLPGDNLSPRCRLVALGEDDVRRIVGVGSRHPISVNDLAWFDDAGLALVVGIDRTSEDVAIAEEKGRALVASRFPGLGHTIETSPAGSFYAIWFGGTLIDLGTRNGDSVFSRFNGSSVRLTWSPDDRWMAVTSFDAVFLVRAGEDDLVRRLPIVARDLAWR